MQDLSAPIPQNTQQGSTVDALELAAIAWRGKWRIVLFALIGATLGVLNIKYMSTYLYTAKAAIAIESRQEQLLDFDSVLSGLSPDYLTIQTETQLLQARNLAERLVDRLNLMEDPEFNGYLPVEPGPVMLMLCEYVPILCEDGPEEAIPPSQREIRDSVIDAVLGALRVTNVEQSLVWELSFTVTDPEKAALMADTLAELYAVEQLETKFEATERATAWMTERTAALQIELEQAELAFEEFNSNTDLVNPDVLALQNRQLKEFRDRLSRAEESRIEIDLRRAELVTLSERLAAGDPLPGIVAEANMPALNAALRRFGDTEQTRQTAVGLLDEMISQTDTAATRADAQIGAMRTQVTELGEALTEQSTDLVRLQQLQRETEATRLLYEYFLNRQKETEVQLGLQQADSRVISRAVVPRVASSPRPAMVVAFSFVLGAFAGTALVLRRELWLRGFHSGKDLEAATGMMVAGQVPEAPSRQRRRLLSYVVKNPNSAMVEAVRNLRTSILMSVIDHPPQVIMVTSSMPKEGKTTLSMTLAHSFSGLDKRVLLIEGDLRRQVVREYFKARNTDGLVSVVSGESPLEDAIYKHEDLGIDILFGSATKINAADFFSSESFRTFLTGLREKYDTILIDTPPVVLVPDARVIGREADAVLYVVHWNRTPRFQVAEGLNALRTAGVKVTGVVLNNIDPRAMRRYVYGQGYYHTYYRN